MKINAIVSVLALIAMGGAGLAADQTTVAERTTTITITDPIKITKILRAVPAIQGTLADRLTAARLTVTALAITWLTEEDVADEGEASLEGWGHGDQDFRQRFR